MKIFSLGGQSQLALVMCGLLLGFNFAFAAAKVSVCHVPPEDPLNPVIIEISDKAVPAHIKNHADLILTLGQTENSTQGSDRDLCHDGFDNDCDGVVDNCAREFKYVFTTRDVFQGNLGNLEGANEKCNAAANAAKQESGSLLIGANTFTAWLSNTSTNAIDRVPLGLNEYRNLDGVIVFNNGIVAPYLPLVPLNVDEYGEQAILTNFVWTNTRPNGLRFSLELPKTCTNWESNSPTLTGTAGDMSATDARWTLINTLVASCNMDAHLYCFED